MKAASPETHYDIHEDLSDKLHGTWRSFNAAHVTVFLRIHPDKSKVAAGLALLTHQDGKRLRSKIYTIALRIEPPGDSVGA